MWPGYFRSHSEKNGAGQPSAREHPASRSGTTTVFSGVRIFDVSAMKWTPQKTMTGFGDSFPLRASSSESPTKSARSWISDSW